MAEPFLLLLYKLVDLDAVNLFEIGYLHIKYMKLLYVTSNTNKFAEAKLILGNYQLEQINIELDELQGDAVSIVTRKALEAYKQIKSTLVVEDVSLHCDALNGFPGPYIKDMLKAMGEGGIYNLVSALGNLKAQVVCSVAFVSKQISDPVVFQGALSGGLVSPRGKSRFGVYSWNPIFVPDGEHKTFGELSLEEQSKISMRKIALSKLVKYFKENSLC